MSHKHSKKTILIMSLLMVTAIGIYFYSSMIKSEASGNLQTVSYTLDKSCEITLSEQSSWKDNNNYGDVIDISLKNIGTNTIQGWTLKIVFKDKPVIEQTWCADSKTESNDVKLTPLAYNNTLASGQSINIGFVIKSSKHINYNNIELYLNDKKADISSEDSEATYTLAPLTPTVKSSESVQTTEPNVNEQTAKPSEIVQTPKPADNTKERYFTEKLSVNEMKSRSEAIPKDKVKQLLYDEIDEHWDILSSKLGQKDKKKVYALFLGFATRESTLNAGVETAQDEGFGVNPAHAFGPLQTAVTAFSGCNDSFMKEDDVPDLYQFEWNEANFYDPKVSTHMGVRKFIHFINESQSYGLKDIEVVRGALKGFNTGHANYEPDNTTYYASYPDEIAAMAGWYYINNHFNNDVFTWTGDPRVDRSDCWGWWN